MRIRNVALAAAIAAVAGVALAQGASQPAPQQPGAAPDASAPSVREPGYGPRHHHHRGGYGRMMMRLDTDGDEQVSRDELLAAQKAQFERFEKADASRDGKLSVDEMRAMRREWRGKGPGGMGPGAMNPGAMGPGAMGPGAMGPGAMGSGSMGSGSMDRGMAYGMGPGNPCFDGPAAATPSGTVKVDPSGA